MKRVVISVAAILVIVVAVVLIVRSTRAPGMPPAVANELEKKIDYKTGEVIELTRGKWAELYAGEGNLYKNTKTGEYTIVDTMRCHSCGEVIPQVPLTAELIAKGHDAVHEVTDNYKCPKCGKAP